jgi:hypothetical protein
MIPVLISKFAGSNRLAGVQGCLKPLSHSSGGVLEFCFSDHKAEIPVEVNARHGLADWMQSGSKIHHTARVISLVGGCKQDGID